MSKEFVQNVVLSTHTSKEINIDYKTELKISSDPQARWATCLSTGHRFSVGLLDRPLQYILHSLSDQPAWRYIRDSSTWTDFNFLKTPLPYFNGEWNWFWIFLVFAPTVFFGAWHAGPWTPSSLRDPRMTLWTAFFPHTHPTETLAVGSFVFPSIGLPFGNLKILLCFPPSPEEVVESFGWFSWSLYTSCFWTWFWTL